MAHFPVKHRYLCNLWGYCFYYVILYTVHWLAQVRNLSLLCWKCFGFPDGDRWGKKKEKKQQNNYLKNVHEDDFLKSILLKPVILQLTVCIYCLLVRPKVFFSTVDREREATQWVFYLKVQSDHDHWKCAAEEMKKITKQKSEWLEDERRGRGRLYLSDKKSHFRRPVYSGTVCQINVGKAHEGEKDREN